ncbi:Putative Glycosyltransferase OS=Legionella pneumophila subsp. pneumophila GN=LPO_2074 PE=4 SV=1: Gly_transf_sug [Gemmata massiliana]|uniref:Uncharacterized protein n=1 Tax=Gemmata massiliana TaxID=1210884 RepID=A0A6P2CUQ8_9BACT|nr:glycosyltransferase [Gemmata massiliana]VTR92653.1 Putative Glycosyltransferase OS=Legionella pneumophila subsp. pneumophila GN=LPO_2074 PE=4 SV=1: Gly_transf_sug [Gemmata massiliana]
MIKKLHFIWVGSFVPMSKDRPYFQRIQKWATANRGWQVHLWYSSKTLDGLGLHMMGRLKREFSGITYMDCGQSSKKVLVGLDDMFSDELYLQYPNYGAASDILRVAILIKHGGLYLDTDVDTGKPLGSLSAPHKFLVNQPLEGAYSNDILYAGKKGHPFFIKYRKKMIESYKTYSAKAWAADRRTNKDTKNAWTQMATGPGCLTDVINEGYKNLGASILFPKDRVTQTSSDCSWL